MCACVRMPCKCGSQKMPWGLAEVSPLPPPPGAQLILEVKLLTVDRLWSSSEAESRNLERYWPEKMVDKYRLWVIWRTEQNWMGVEWHWMEAEEEEKSSLTGYPGTERLAKAGTIPYRVP